jgi:cyclohexanone monooxygenase
MPYVGGIGRYRQICDEVAADNYRGFVQQPNANAAGQPDPAARA